MANIDGDATGASANDVADDATAKADDVNGTKQTATSNDPFLMAQADVAATNPNALVQGVYDAPTGVTLDDIDTQGADLLVTLPTGDVLRIEDAVSQFGQVEIAGVLFSIPWEIIPGAPGLASGGGNFIVDPGEIGPAIPIKPLLGPTELAFGLPDEEEIFLLDDTEPEITEVENTRVDEDGFRFANVDVPLPTEFDGDENLSDTGNITVNYKADVPGDLDAALVLDDLDSYDGQLQTLDGHDVVFALEGGDLVGRSAGDNSEVIRISIQPGPDDLGAGFYTYTYEVTLSQPVEHPTNDTEDIITLVGVQFTATDEDGDSVSGITDVEIIDDVPHAMDDCFVQMGEQDEKYGEKGPKQNIIPPDWMNGENESVIGNVLDDNGFGADEFGADGEGTPTVTLVGNSLTGNGTLTLNTDGSFEYEPGAGEEGDVTFQYFIQDDDGDRSTATVTIKLQDDSEPTEESPDAEVDEDGFTATANVDLPTGLEADSTEDATDAQTITIDYGNDVPSDIDAAFTLNDLGTYDGQLITLTGNAVNFALESGVLVGRDSVTNDIIITIEITSSTDNGGGSVDYEYTVTLSQPVQHPTNDNEDTDTLSGVQFSATDSDGDGVTGTFNVDVVDDVPNLIAGDPLTITNAAPNTASTGFSFSEGADGVGAVVFVGTDNTEAFDSVGNQIFSGSDPVLLTGYGTSTLTGYIDNDSSGTFNLGDTVVLTVEINEASDNWFAQIDVDLDNGSASTFDLLSGISGGNNAVQAVGADDAVNNNDNVDLILQALGGSVNTSNGRIGVGGGQSISSGELVKIEFVVNAVATADPLDDTGFNWDDMFATNVFRQEVNRVTGAQSNGANFTVQAYDVFGLGDDELTDDLPGGAGTDLDTLVEITNAQLYDANDVLIFDIATATYDSVTDHGDGTFTYLVSGTDSEGTSYSVTVFVDTNASSYQVSFEGVLEGWEYAIEADNTFESVAVAGDPGGFDFTLGALILGEESTGEPFNMEFDILGTDGDGDAIASTLTLTVEPPVEAALAEPAIFSFAPVTEGDATGTGTLDNGDTITDPVPVGSEPSGISLTQIDILSQVVDEIDRVAAAEPLLSIDTELYISPEISGVLLATNDQFESSNLNGSLATTLFDGEFSMSLEQSTNESMEVLQTLDLASFDLSGLLDSGPVMDVLSTMQSSASGATMVGEVTGISDDDLIQLSLV